MLTTTEQIAVINNADDPFWTLVVLHPPQANRCIAIDGLLQTAICEDATLVAVIARAIHLVLESTWRGWESLVSHIDVLLGTGHYIFDIEAHNNLLFDDDLYTRSRRYFWAINCLNESLNVIERSIQTFITQRDTVLIPMAKKIKTEEGMREFDDQMKSCDDALQKLMKIKESFNEQRPKAIALRDGVSSRMPFSEIF